MSIAVNGTPEFERELLALLGYLHPETVTVTHENDHTWTEERAYRLLGELPGDAARLVRYVIEGSGQADANRLREAFDGLKGPTISLMKALTRGIHEGWWPAGLPEPVTPHYKEPSSRRATSYRMDDHLLETFRDALARRDAGIQQTVVMWLEHPGNPQIALERRTHPNRQAAIDWAVDRLPALFISHVISSGPDEPRHRTLIHAEFLSPGGTPEYLTARPKYDENGHCHPEINWSYDTEEMPITDLLPS